LEEINSHGKAYTEEGTAHGYSLVTLVTVIRWFNSIGLTGLSDYACYFMG